MPEPEPKDLAAWLTAAGLGHAAPAFAREKIAPSQLAELSDGDLRELGLTMGERLTYRSALLRMPVLSPSTVRTLPERRPLTVMFVDVVDSTRLSDSLDVEDLIEVIRIYREFCDIVVRKFGGHVAQFFGDGIMAYFCYPVAHENDAQRAVNAGVEIARGMPTITTPAGEPIQVRIGIATGRVVMSDLFSGGSVEERKVSGATPNLAARLQALATPGDVVISELTHERVGHLFECRERGQAPLRGFATPQSVFTVIAPRDSAPARRTAGAPMTPMFGRELELSHLDLLWSQVETGSGAAVVVSGEAGIGKSRLVDRFLGALPEASATVLRMQTSVLDSESPLHPVVTLLRTLSGFEPGDGAEDRFDKLRHFVGGPQAAADATVLADLLQVRTDPAVADLPPAAVRARVLAAIVRQLAAVCAGTHACVVVEDLHWADATSRALLAALAAATAETGLMILVTTRDEDGAKGIFPDDSTSWIPLTRLDRGEVVGMLQSMFGDAPIPADIARQIAERTDGIPLFIEEYVRPLLLANVNADWTVMAPRPIEGIAIPMSLHESLMARLDRSGSAKELAQIASVMGRTARPDVLAQVSGLPMEMVRNALASLEVAGVIHIIAEGGVEVLQFGHALVRDAAYESILRDRKRQLHAAVGQALEALDPEVAELQPELLATHYTEGGMLDRALGYWVTSSERSIRRSSLFEAISLIRRALAAIEDQERTPERKAAMLRLMALLGPALIAVRGPGSIEAQQLYASAYEHVGDSFDSTLHFRLAWGWWRVARNFEIKTERAELLLNRARRRADNEMMLQAHHCNWAAQFERGDLCNCVRHVRAGLAIYEGGDFSHHASMYGNHDARVCGHGELAQVFWMQGNFGAADEEERRSAAWAERLGHLGSRVHAMDMALLHRSFQRDWPVVLSMAKHLIDFTADHGLIDHRAKGLIFKGWALGQSGNVTGGLAELRGGIARQREIGTIEDFPMYLGMLAETLVLAKQPDAAVEVLTQGIAEFDAVGLRIWLPEVHRHLGRAMLAADPANTAAAAAMLDRAVALARDQGAAMLTIRAAADLAGIIERAGDLPEAHRRLSGALASMRPGIGTAETAAIAAHADRLAERLGPAGSGRAA